MSIPKTEIASILMNVISSKKSSTSLLKKSFKNYQFDFSKSKNFFTRLLGTNNFCEKIRVTKIAGDEAALSHETFLFCYRVMLRTIEACISMKYTEFDGHTTSNCCHGMSLFVRELILKIKDIDLNALKIEGAIKLEALERGQLQPWFVPSSLIELANIYIIAFAKEVDPIKGDRTSKKKLKIIAPIGKSVCFSMVGGIQKKYSEFIAKNYHNLFLKLNSKCKISKAPLEMWGKYVSHEYIRKDKYGIHYAPAMFSMQICLAHLISSKAKIACIVDLLSADGQLNGRYPILLQGDGNQEFVRLDLEQYNFLDSSQKEPIVVFGGCVYSNSFDINQIRKKIRPWLKKFTNLVLACDIYYPQFPILKDDPEFNQLPISPVEKQLQKLISHFSKIKGVTSEDPSLFCLTHIYSASLSQFLKVLTEEDIYALPINTLPLERRLQAKLKINEVLT